MCDFIRKLLGLNKLHFPMDSFITRKKSSTKIEKVALYKKTVLKRGSPNEEFHFIAKIYNSNRHLVWLCVLEKKIRNLS